MPTPNQPPKTGWAKMVPEILVNDFPQSMAFWTGPLGFNIAYARLDEQFAYLERPEGAQVMLSYRHGGWETAQMEQPFGRGVMFQVYVDNLDEIQSTLKRAKIDLHTGPRETWRNWGDREGGAKEIFVQDPNGYLLMIAQHIGERPLSDIG